MPRTGRPAHKGASVAPQKTQPIVVQRTDRVGGDGDDREVVQCRSPWIARRQLRRRTASELFGRWPMAICSVYLGRADEPVRVEATGPYADDAARDGAGHGLASPGSGARMSGGTAGAGSPAAGKAQRCRLMRTADVYAVFLPLMAAGATTLGVMGGVAILAKRKMDDGRP
jgi:hypothetical protein